MSRWVGFTRSLPLYSLSLYTSDIEHMALLTLLNMSLVHQGALRGISIGESYDSSASLLKISSEEGLLG